MATIITRLIAVQILEKTDGKPFAQWNLKELDSTKEALYNALKEITTNSIGYSIGQIPLEKYTTEEICLMFLLLFNPDALGVNATLAEGIITQIRLEIIAGKNPTERATVITNALGQYQQTQKEIDAGTYQPPAAPKSPLDDDNGGNGSETFSLWASIQAALQSPLFWVFVALVLFRIFKRKRNEK